MPFICCFISSYMQAIKKDSLMDYLLAILINNDDMDSLYILYYNICYFKKATVPSKKSKILYYCIRI